MESGMINAAEPVSSSNTLQLSTMGDVSLLTNCLPHAKCNVLLLFIYLIYNIGVLVIFQTFLPPSDPLSGDSVIITVIS